jgi:hypothetical protein
MCARLYNSEAKMGLFKKKQKPAITELKCPMKGCDFTCTDPKTLKRHTDWKHPPKMIRDSRKEGD